MNIPDIAIVVFLALANGGTFLLMYRSQYRTLIVNWREAANRLGIKNISVGGCLASPRLEGTLGPFGFSIRINKRSLKKRTVVTLAGAGRFPADLELRRESLGTTAEKLLDGDDIQTGDEAFDREVLLRGREVTAAAVLTARNREAVTEALRAGFSLSGSAITLVVPDLLGSAEEVMGAVQRLRDLAKLLTEPVNPAARLLENLRREPLPPVRKRLVSLLERHFPNAPETATGIRFALADPDPEVRMEAALHPGCPLAVLQELATNAFVDDGIAGRATRAIGRRAPLEWVIGLLEAALERQRGPVVEAAVGLLLTLRDPASEPVLLRVLADSEPNAGKAAAEVLAEIGTIAAVPALRGIAAASLRHLGLQLAARNAIEAIQKRAAGAAPGQLALSEAEAGALALAGPTLGGVSLIEASVSECADKGVTGARQSPRPPARREVG